jgi:signal peptidase II
MPSVRAAGITAKMSVIMIMPLSTQNCAGAVPATSTVRAKFVRLPSPESWFGLAALVIGLDQITKLWVLAVFYLGESIAVTDFFNLVLVFNSGAAFSFLAGAGGWQKWFFVVLALGISAWLAVMIRQHAAERLMPAALALVLGGALGNVIDRLRFGAVVDFLDFHVAGWHWPAFNVADSAISVGVTLLFIEMWREDRKKSVEDLTKKTQERES